jgi:HAD superfamily hydrolase (TIGR01484 family)
MLRDDSMALANIKMIAVDMDGTLLNDQDEISTETITWLQQARQAGYIVCIATGRSMRSAAPYIAQMGLEGPFVFVNGSEVWASPTQLYQRTVMPLAHIETLRTIAITEDVWYWGYCTDGVYNTRQWHPTPTDTDWLKFGFQSEDLDALARIRKQADKLGIFEITNSDTDNLEMNPLGIHKAAGLEQACQLLGLTLDQVVAFGDSLNDLKMIQQAGIGVAMGNAQDTVKQAADYVTASNNQHGIATFIRDHLLG